jgi:hypothetical protein
VLLLLVSFAAVPCMLVPKPLILKKRHEASQRSVRALLLPGVVSVVLLVPPPPSAHSTEV